MRTVLLLLPLLLCLPAKPGLAARKGHLAIIGGALAPDNAGVYTEIIRRGKGKDKCRVVILAAASATPVRSGNAYREDFIRFGVAPDRVRSLELALLNDPGTPEFDESKWSINHSDSRLVSQIDQADIAFMAGGDQSRYTQLLLTPAGGDTPLLQALRRLLKRGGIIAGTSAGAAVMSDPMITGGDSQDSLLAPDPPGSGSPVTIARGLGFWPRGLVDQHFLRRGRWGRLVSALMQSKRNCLGLGVGENTAAFIAANKLTVIGSGAVVVIDRTAVKSFSRSPWHVKGLILHYLQDGDRIDLNRLQVHANPRRKRRAVSGIGDSQPQRTPMAGAFFDYGLSRLLIEQLVEPGCSRARALAWDDRQSGVVKGIEAVARITPQTRIFQDRGNGRPTWTLQHIGLDLLPITITIQRSRNENGEEK